jgi:hypothetical protein
LKKWNIRAHNLPRLVDAKGEVIEEFAKAGVVRPQ